MGSNPAERAINKSVGRMTAMKPIMRMVMTTIAMADEDVRRWQVLSVLTHIGVVVDQDVTK